MQEVILGSRFWDEEVALILKVNSVDYARVQFAIQEDCNLVT
jgi:hypothetical protein